jgi:peptidoglycan/LPS O-acetylase OafA/YrhL
MLRTFLALCVVIEHSGGAFLGIEPLPGLLAVQAFYIISGFYMALVLSEKYTRPGSLRAFYKARTLRLYPMYWTVLGATVALDLLLQVAGVPNRLDAWKASPSSNSLVMFFGVLANLALFGLDWLRLTMDNVYEHSGGLIIVVQAWTLGLELTFYLLVPLLVRLRSPWLVLIASTSFAARAAVYHQGPVIQVWTNGFFPFEFGLFLSGMLAYRALVAIRERPKLLEFMRQTGLPALVVIMAFGFLAFAGSSPVEFGWGPPRNWIMLVMITFALPSLFIRFGNEKYDEVVGQYSYPLYLAHFVAITAVNAVVPKDQFNIVYVVMPLGLLGSYWLIRTFDAPPAKKTVRTGGVMRLRSEEGTEVLVAEHHGEFRLRIPSLKLTVTGSTLAQAYAELIRQKAIRAPSTSMKVIAVSRGDR